MNALEKYATKQHLTDELVKQAQLAGLMNALKGAGAAVKAVKAPAALGKTLGGKTLGEIGHMGLAKVRANPLKAAAGMGAAGFLAGRASK